MWQRHSPKNHADTHLELHLLFRIGKGENCDPCDIYHAMDVGARSRISAHYGHRLTELDFFFCPVLLSVCP